LGDAGLGVCKIVQDHFKENLSISSGSGRLFRVQRIMEFCVRWKELKRIPGKVRGYVNGAIVRI
jgi:hypothetical protein